MNCKIQNLMGEIINDMQRQTEGLEAACVGTHN